MLPEPSWADRETGPWRWYSTPGLYRPWMVEHAPWLEDAHKRATVEGMGCEYTLVPNVDTETESVLFCRADGPPTAGMYVLHVPDEPTHLTALRMALLAYSEVAIEVGDPLPDSITVVPV